MILKNSKYEITDGIFKLITSQLNGEIDVFYYECRYKEEGVGEYI